MLEITLKEEEFYDEATNRFFDLPAETFHLEHSLTSLSKWESIHKKPFLSAEEKTREESLSYIECMCLTPGVTRKSLRRISDKDMDLINYYISDQKTATSIRRQRGGSREIITAEIIYYWMVALTIPFEAADWHLSKLLTLIEVCSIKNQPKKKMGRSEALSRQRALNAQRRASLNSRG